MKDDKNIAMLVGSYMDKEAVENIASTIERIFKSGFEYHMDQETIRVAITAFSQKPTVENVNISSNSISMTSSERENKSGIKIHDGNMGPASEEN